VSTVNQAKAVSPSFVLERDFGLLLPRWIQSKLAGIVQQASDKRAGEIDSQTIYDLFIKHFVCDKTPTELIAHKLTHRNNSDTINVQMTNTGQMIHLNGTGQGALSAFINALMKTTGQKIHVIDYSEHAMKEGTDSAAAAYVHLEIDGAKFMGAAIDNDTVSASLKAVVSGMNQVGVGAVRMVG